MNLKWVIKNPLYILIFGAVIAFVFTGGIMALHAATQAMVQRQEEAFTQRAMIELFGIEPNDPQTGEPIPVDQLSEEEVGRIYNRRIYWPEADNSIRITEAAVGMQGVSEQDVGKVIRVVEAYSAPPTEAEGGELIGYAFPVYGIGYWARIDGWMAVDPQLEQILGIVFLRHSETPGLGGRITENAWREGFEGKSIAAPEEEDTRWVYIGGPVADDPNSPRFQRRVDAVTGATGTSSAVQNFLNDRIPEFRAAALVAIEQGRLPKGADDEQYWRERLGEEE
ncbi:MAG: FMN-binding protein [Planctomycetota bacterium]